ncbi:PPC domain-containing protein [Halomicroarcula sp. F13]|uniref:PPC domain-containing protein n=1 Tax=Haloarcula rubra TaxID=2487747 RepID=A0AAW4PY49_9EURY|nr:PPC domain-containing protein [Halomicroarcula rubra]MBX0325243.1 PPC domain-containing protein [Halomicroarcula rubra]
MPNNGTHGRASPTTIGSILLVCLVVVTTGMAGLSLGQQQQSEQEPNNQQSAATQLEIPPNTPTNVNGVLGLGDEDWFEFDAQEGDTITIDYSGSAGEARLRGPDGTVLDAESSTIQRLQATAEQDGTHYIQLTTTAAANGDYSMEFRLQRADDENGGEETTTPDESSETDSSQSSDNADAPTRTEQDESTGEVTASGDQFADSCDAEGVQPVTPGTYSDLLTPVDGDVLLVNLSEGEFITVNVTYEGPESSNLAIVGSSTSFSAVNGSQVQTIPNTRATRTRAIAVAPGNTQFRVYAESDDGVCLNLYTVEEGLLPSNIGVSGGGGAGTWSLSFTANNPDPRRINQTQVPGDTQRSELASRIAELEQQIADLRERIARLEEQAAVGSNNTTAENWCSQGQPA